MEAKELMIGDWLCYEGEHNIQVKGIDFPPNGNSAYISFGAEFYPCDDFSPIHLTPEILEKNGFEDIGDDTYQLEEKPCWFWVDFFRHTYGCEYDTSTYEYEDDEHRLKLYGTPSVHELQHALRLCRIEKEIIL